MKCKLCGITELTSGDFDGMCSPCKNHQNFFFANQHGWICPKCGSVYAPFVQECWKCSNKSITCSETISVDRTQSGLL
jgi:hypothetical protein